MSYNGSGIYTLPGAQLVNGEVVSATENNQFRNDVATALNTAWTRDGQSPATGNIPMGSHKFTGMAAGVENGDSVRYEQVTSAVAITGGTIDGATIGATTPDTGVFTDLTVNGNTIIGNASSDTLAINPAAVSTPNGLNFDSNTLVIDATNNRVGVGTASPDNKLTVAGVIESSTGGFKFPDGTGQLTAARNKVWAYVTSTGSYTVPDGVYSVRAYAFGAGGDGWQGGSGASGGGGGGCAYGDIAVNPGETISVTISSGIATVTYDGTTLLTANPGSNGVTISGGAGGTASKDALVTNGGAYSGGAGGSSPSGSPAVLGCGGGASGSPVGIGGAGGSTETGGGGGGAGGAGGAGYGGGGGGAGGAGSTTQASGGAGGAASGSRGGIGRQGASVFTDPILAECMYPGSSGCIDIAGVTGGPGAGGNGANSSASNYAAGHGGKFGGGGGAHYGSGGNGGFGGGGGGGTNGGNGGYGGGGGGSAAYPSGTKGLGGAAIVCFYA